MEKLTGQNLYDEVKERICDDIFYGKYHDGDRLPSERELQDELGISRVTVRKSLELLEEDHLILREIGRGTRITLKNLGNPNPLDMIVLIAPARNPFFSEFIGRFQNYAEKKDTLILYLEKPGDQSLEECMYHLYKRGLRNVVIWLEDLPIDPDRLKRLRAIGMNIVFFDTDTGLPYADCVSTDNTDAIRCLYSKISEKTSKITYICWDNLDSYSSRMRRAAFEECVNDSYSLLSILYLPWKKRKKSLDILCQKLAQLEKSGTEYILCCDRECSEMALPLIQSGQFSMKIAGVDDISDSHIQLRYKDDCENDLTCQKPDILIYRQDLGSIVEKIYICLENQCTLKEKWCPNTYLIPGNVIQ